MKVGNSSSYTKRAKRKRPGVVSKTRTSNHKNSRNYRKKYRGQGR